jgi:hypothetical protein
MFCSNCGTELNNGSRFCNYCGAPQKNPVMRLDNTPPVTSRGAYSEAGEFYSRPGSAAPPVFSRGAYYSPEESGRFNAASAPARTASEFSPNGGALKADGVSVSKGISEPKEFFERERVSESDSTDSADDTFESIAAILADDISESTAAISEDGDSEPAAAISADGTSEPEQTESVKAESVEEKKIGSDGFPIGFKMPPPDSDERGDAEPKKSAVVRTADVAREIKTLSLFSILLSVFGFAVIGFAIVGIGFAFAAWLRYRQAVRGNAENAALLKRSDIPFKVGAVLGAAATAFQILFFVFIFLTR